MLDPPVNPAQPSGGKDTDSGPVRPQQGGGYGGGSGPSSSQSKTQVAAADLEHAGLRSQALELGRAQAHPNFAVHHGNRGGNRTVFTHQRLHVTGHLEVLRMRHSV